ncbi:MAG: hypothetical protein ABIF17_00815 [Patescibacteria group bacterium]
MLKRIKILTKMLISIITVNHEELIYTLDMHDVLPEGLWGDFYEDYVKSMTIERSKYPHDQLNYTRKEFNDACKDPDILKMVFRINGEPAGFALMTKPGAIHKAPWVSPPFYCKTGKEVMYLTILIMLKEHRSFGHVIVFFDRIIHDVTRTYPGVVYGYDIPTGGKEWLYRIILRRIQKDKTLIVREAGSQKYFLVEWR